jgi:hypothetical protein
VKQQGWYGVALSRKIVFEKKELAWGQKKPGSRFPASVFDIATKDVHRWSWWTMGVYLSSLFAKARVRLIMFTAFTKQPHVCKDRVSRFDLSKADLDTGLQ